jgi:hypothetical protein
MKITGEAKFEQQLRDLICAEDKRRKIGRSYILSHVVSVVNSLRTSKSYEWCITSCDIKDDQ